MTPDPRQSINHSYLRAGFALIALLLAAGTVAAQKNFYNEEFKIGFKYPATWQLKTNDLDDCRTCVEPDSKFKGLAQVSTHANRSETATLSAARITADACKFSTDAKPKPVKMGAITFDKTEDVDGGTESITDVEYYRTFHDGVCYDVSIAVQHPKYTSTNKLNEKGKYQGLFNQLQGVLRTFYFGK
jgi:hypothetical protein